MVCIILGCQPRRFAQVSVRGTGAAGMAAIWSLSRFPDHFQVEAWDHMPQPRGVATSEPIKSKQKDSPSDAWINNGVQAVASTYRNALLMMGEFGFRGSPFHIMLSFGKGDNHWANYEAHPPSTLVHQLQPDITRFGCVLRWINRLEPLFVFVPIRLVLRVLGFSDEFRNRMVFPLEAVFFGTGNQTPKVSVAIITCVFLDNLQLFEYNPNTLLSQKPLMYAFPSLGKVYRTMEERIDSEVNKPSNGNKASQVPPSVTFQHNCTVQEVQRLTRSS